MDLSNALIDILIIVVPLLAGLVGKYIVQIIGTERIAKVKAELATKSELTAKAVALAEQAYNDLDGAGKYEKALDWLSTQALAIGIKITAEEAKGLIEAAVLALKKNL